MKTLLSRSTALSAALLATTFATHTFAKDADLQSLIEAAQKKARSTVWECQTVGQTGKARGKI